MGNEEYLIGVAALAKYLQVHYNTAQVDNEQDLYQPLR